MREWIFVPTFKVSATFCRGTHRVGLNLALERSMKHANSSHSDRRRIRIADGPVGHYGCYHLRSTGPDGRTIRIFKPRAPG